MPTGQRVTRDNWREIVRGHGLSLRGLAGLTGANIHSVESWAMGRRRPSDAWIAKVSTVVDALDGVDHRESA